jgi:hypothetical protein
MLPRQRRRLVTFVDLQDHSLQSEGRGTRRQLLISRIKFRAEMICQNFFYILLQ